MKRTLMLTMALATLALLPAQQLRAHCEVPCGIYADEHRFEEMLEDTATISKAIAQINEIAASMEEGPNGKSINQATRWVTTKESHATNTQHIIAQYFMTQRIKPGTDEASKKAYVKKLTAAHAVMVAAMKCKQDANPETATVLKAAILDFYRAYEGKEPQLH